MEQHAGLLPEDDLEATDGRSFLEHHGLVDLNGVRVPGHHRMAAALANTIGSERPDLVIKHGTSFVNDYNNPELFPGMFPALFPWDVGGLGGKREVPLSFARRGSSLLDLADPAFRQHWSYIFVVANIKQRHAINNHSRLTCQSGDHSRFAEELRNMDADLLKTVYERLLSGRWFSDLPPDEAAIFSLLKKCELVSQHVPGSKAVMNRARADIRSYVGKFGIFQLFMTLNPSPLHSPIFQIFYGDTSVTLDTSTPTLPSASERAKRVADDPVSASDFFHFHLASVFNFLFGWDVRKSKSTPEGGLLGPLSAFFVVKEHTMRGQLHGHILIWLEGGLNPSDLRQRMRDQVEFRERYLAFMYDIISHELPNPSQFCSDDHKHRHPRQELCPDPSTPDYMRLFEVDHKLLGEAVQRHRCQPTCHKGGQAGCRFLFPHDLNKAPFFDVESSSIMPRVNDATVNWHNPSLLVATRHNHDLKSVQSGKSGMAAASYITTYATKSEETPANQVQMIKTVSERLDALGEETDNVQRMLSKCVMQFGRERQLHAQQVATYVRDLGDVWKSHKTVAMLSGSMIQVAQRRYGTPLTSNDVAPEERLADNILLSGDHAEVNTATCMAADSSRDGTNNVPPCTNADLLPDGTNNNRANQLYEEGDEDESHFLSLSLSGRAHQVDDYLHRGDTLEHLAFYDFVQHCKLDKKPKKMNKNHHLLASTHPNFDDFCHRYYPSKSFGIPRAIFNQMPRRDGTPTHGDAYCSAMLVHFKPFSHATALKDGQETYQDAFWKQDFPAVHRHIMDNWAALTECEDARDAE
ncbi:hypothetical protein CF335_g5594 [Tilletia laevis]|nr:hypothetical protein CF335_g5594 [Tilletia laevis]